MAVRNTVRAPNRSANQPLAGMNTATLKRYAVIARLRRIGSSSIACAMLGSAVEMIVESRFSMNSAQATIIGIRNWRGGRGIDDFVLGGERNRSRQSNTHRPDGFALWRFV